MYCIANICNVCLEKKNQPITNINRSLSANKDIIHIIGYLPFDLAWLKTNEIILICDECCARLRQTYQFHVMCVRNSALLQSYKDNLKSTSNTSSEAQLTVTLNLSNKHADKNAVKCAIKLEDEEMDSDECEPVNFEADRVVKEEEEDDTSRWEVDTWNWDEPGAKEEHPPGNSSTSALIAQIWVNTNAHITSVNPGSACKNTPDATEVNAAARKSHTCTVCGRSFCRNNVLTMHTRIHTGERPYECATCGKAFSRHWSLVMHTRLHTGVKPYECSTCDQSFRLKSVLNNHMRVHTGEKPHECSICKKAFRQHVTLVKHLCVHTGKKST